VENWRLALGLLGVATTVVGLAAAYVRRPKPARFPGRGWVGIALILAGEILLFSGFRWVAIYFTPLAWTGYLLLIDAAVFSLKGESPLGNRPREFFKLAFWSVPLWLIFEAYNLRLQNWTYVGLPMSPVLQAIGYVWSFATIWPAILGTADFLEALGWFASPSRGARGISVSGHFSLIMLGMVFVLAPLLVPVRFGQYLFGAVWVGFVLLLDPLNFFGGGRSLLGDLEAGRRTTLYSLLVSGLVCGILWEFWNYWAAAKWVYIFPIMQGWKIFQMPLAGYLGFPPFALECFVMYEFLGTVRRQLRVASNRG